MMQTVLMALVNQRQQQHHLQQLPVIQQCSGLGLRCSSKDL
jgi:hypothetical protein